MKVISLASAKGGVGKSTLAVNLACAALEDGHTVALLDMDPQGTALLWHELRSKRFGEGAEPSVQQTTAETLRRDLRALAHRRKDYVFLDMPGSSTTVVQHALRQCDLVLVPSRASIIDIAPATETIEAAMQLGKSFCYVMNFVPSEDVTMFNAVKDHLENAGFMVSPVAIPDSPTFPDAFLNGRSATEHEPDGKAAQEIRWLWRFVKGLV